MQTRQLNRVWLRECLFILLFLTAFFLLIEISFFIECNKFYISDFKFVSAHLQVPRKIFPPIIFFVFAQLFVHLLFCLTIYLFCVSFKLYLFRNFKIETISIALWSFGIVTILCLNWYYFPNSKFADLFSGLLSHSTLQKLIILLLSCWSVLFLFLLAGFWRFFPKFKLLFFSALLLTLFIFLTPTKPIQDGATLTKPNIILIGLDSLRPDFTGYFGDETRTPFLDAFLEKSVVFANALTPLARTFPSWVGILTGKYPKENGVRYNLAPQSALNYQESLPHLLKNKGYYNIYASDETRFSNIDHRIGFNQLITPPIGLNDFLLGTFNDFPISNLLLNSKLGKFLFPYAYANRAVFFTYDPNSFIENISNSLPVTRKKPLFLCIHFCLTHHPFLWASLDSNQFDVWGRYQASIERIDQQVAALFNVLQHKHLLDHAMVFIFSDHGEALEFPGDRITDAELSLIHPIPSFYPSSIDHELIDESAGHGTDILSLAQYRVLLAYRFFGFKKQTPQLATQLVSLLDIKPTVLASLGDHVSHSLFHETKERHFFVESDFSPEAVRTVYPQIRQVLLEGVALFRINPSLRLTVKPEMGNMIIHSKQIGDIYHHWMLAYYPQQDKKIPILINLKTGIWTTDMHSVFALQSPYLKMHDALENFYKEELGDQN